MKTPAEHVRLACATASATGSILFVTVYSFAKGVHFKGALAGLPLPNLTVWLVASEWYALFVPFCLLILGLVLLRRSRSGAWFELVIGCLWLFASFWFALAVFVWTLPEIPLIEDLHQVRHG